MTNSIEKSIERLIKTRPMKGPMPHHSNKDDVEAMEEKAKGSQHNESVDAPNGSNKDLSGQFIPIDTPNSQAGTDLIVASDKMGEILIAQGKLSDNDVTKIIEYQQEKGLYFGEAALKLKLVNESDILKALSVQFGYTYERTGTRQSKEMVMANSPFGPIAEEFRSIRSQLLNNWLSPEQNTLAVISPEKGTGSSYVAANLAMAFSQLGRSTLLIDADMRSPRQHTIFNFPNRVGLSMLLAERVTIADLNGLPYKISGYPHLSVLGCSAIPPNPVELLSKDVFPIILGELEKNFDVIILDSPSASYRADVTSIASAAGNALLVVKGGQSRIDTTKHLISLLNQSKVRVVGAVLNQF